MELPRILFFIIVSFIYAAVLRFLFRKMLDIFRHEKSYGQIRNFDRYENSIWSDSWEPKHGKGFNLHFLSGILATAFLAFPLCAAFYFGLIWIQKLLYKPAGNVIIFPPATAAIGLIAAIILSSFLTAYICLASDVPFLIAASMTIFKYNRRIKNWQMTIIGLLTTFAIAFPLIALSIDNYVYISENEIVENPYLSFEDIRMPLNNVVKVKTRYSRHTGRGGVNYNYDYVVILNDGLSIDISGGGSRAVRFVHERLSNQAVEFEKGRVAQKDFAEIESLYSDLVVSLYRDIFVIDQG